MTGRSPVGHRVVAALVCLLALGVTQRASRAEKMGFVRRVGDRLVEGGRPFRFVSFNIPNLHLQEDEFGDAAPSPWRWPDGFEVADGLETIRQLNGRVVRTYVLAVRRESSDMGDHVHVRGPGEFNEEAFAALDLVLRTAAEKGVRVIVPLVDQWRWWGGVEQYAGFRGRPPEDFWTDRQLIEDFKQTIAYVLRRRNTLTGVLYRDDPAILGWETGNEISPPPSWTREIAAYIKSLDPNHLVIDGDSLDGASLASIPDPNVDVLTSHHYPNRGEDIPRAIAAVIRQTAGAKPYFVGEVGFLSLREVEDILRLAEPSHTAGVLLWSLRTHRREGGFYWHSEPMAGGRFKAYHWPGFESGAPYDESAVLRLTRDAAFRFRDEPGAPAPPPGPPVLLPIDDPADIRWRGSAGASGYDVQRSRAPDGPWATIAENVSDAESPYRALFNDQSAPVAGRVYYRVIARNDTGGSPPSNAVGPVDCRERTLVEEFHTPPAGTAVTGDASIVTDDARAAREDRGRLRLAPGASVRFDSTGVIRSVTVVAFASGAGSPEVSLVDARGAVVPSTTHPVRAEHQAAGDYGYLRPIRSVTESAGAPAVGAVVRASDRGEIELGRVEVRYRHSPEGAPEAPGRERRGDDR